MVIDNPAQRLYAILAQAAAQNRHHPVRVVWASVAEVEPADLHRIYLFLGGLNELTRDTRATIESIPDLDYELFIGDWPKILKAISPTNLDEQWTEYQKHLDPGVMRSLQFCAYELRKHYEELPVERGDLDEILAEVEELIRLVLSSSLEGTVAAVIIDLLNTVRQSVLDYRLRGIAGLRQALLYGAGMIGRCQEVLREQKAPSIAERLLQVLQHLQTVVTVATKAKALWTAAAPLLPLPPTSPDG